LQDRFASFAFIQGPKMAAIADRAPASDKAKKHVEEASIFL
jgi:hypothetical protein